MDPLSKTKEPRKRTANYTADEKALLTQLIKKRPFVETKLSDGKSIAKKRAEWEMITREFNRRSHVYKRDTLALKRAWDNMKGLNRKSKAAARRNLMRTVGGHSTHPQTPDMGAKASMVEEPVPAFCDIKDSYHSDDSNSDIISQEPPFLLSQPYRYQEYEKDILTQNGTEEPLSHVSKQQSSTFTQSLQSDQCQKENHQSPSITQPLQSVQTSKPTDFVIRETMRRREFSDDENNMKMQILKAQFKTALSNKRRAENEEEASKIRLELELQKAHCNKRAAENDEKASKIRLEKATLEIETFKKKLGLKIQVSKSSSAIS